MLAPPAFTSETAIPVLVALITQGLKAGLAVCCIPRRVAKEAPSCFVSRRKPRKSIFGDVPVVLAIFGDPYHDRKFVGDMWCMQGSKSPVYPQCQ